MSLVTHQLSSTLCYRNCTLWCCVTVSLPRGSVVCDLPIVSELVWLKLLCCCKRQVDVTFCDARATDPQGAPLTNRDRLPCIIENVTFGIWQWSTNRQRFAYHVLVCRKQEDFCRAKEVVEASALSPVICEAAC